MPSSIFRYTYFLSCDTLTNKKAYLSRDILTETLNITLNDQSYLPHITAYYHDREEDDEAVKRQAMPVLREIQAKMLYFNKVEIFPSKNKDAIVYTFLNSEWINKLNIQLCIAHRKTNKIKTPHLTIVRDSPKVDPIICSLLPSFSHLSAMCTSISIVKHNEHNRYKTIYKMPLK